MEKLNGATDVEILYEDNNYLVLNKPSGLMVHPDGKNEDKTLSDLVLESYPEMESVGERFRCGIVHRLDRETSGVITLAKNQKAHQFLKKQFQERKVKKTYKAFAHGVFKEKTGVIERPIARSKRTGLWSAGRGTRGKERAAITEYRVLKEGKGITFLEVSPRTGRTHQIRVHLKSINHPVVCDKVYNPKGGCVLGFERLALHAERLEFQGLSGEKIEVVAPLPSDFEGALGLL